MITDITAWTNAPEVRRPALVVGKGPTFDHIHGVDTQHYTTITLNHACRHVHADLALFNDWSAWLDCRDHIIDSTDVGMVYRPHIDEKPSAMTLDDAVEHDDVLARQAEAGQLFAWTIKMHADHGYFDPYTMVPCFSTVGEVAVWCCLAAGFRHLTHVGLDGGKTRSASFDPKIDDASVYDRGATRVKKMIGRYDGASLLGIRQLKDRRRREAKKYAGLFDRHARYGHENHGADAMPIIAAMNPDSLLDVGCGGNEFVRQISQALPQCDAVGVDPSSPFADLASEAHELPFSDRSFDVVTAFDVLEHLLPEDLDACLLEMLRVGRRMVLSIGYGDSVNRDQNGETLHAIAQPESWWAQRLARLGRLTKLTDDYWLIQR